MTSSVFYIFLALMIFLTIERHLFFKYEERVLRGFLSWVMKVQNSLSLTIISLVISLLSSKE